MSRRGVLRTGAKKLKGAGRWVDDTLRAGADDALSSTGKVILGTGALVGGTKVTGNVADAYAAKQERLTNQEYMDARERILNDPNLSAEEKQRRLDALRKDFRGGGGGPSSWFEDISMTQAMMMLGFGYLLIRAFAVMGGAAA